MAQRIREMVTHWKQAMEVLMRELEAERRARRTIGGP